MRHSKSRLAEATRELSEQLEKAEFALHDLIARRVTWFRRGRYSLGVSRETTGSGPLAITVYRCPGQSPQVCVYRWAVFREWIFSTDPGEHNKEARDLRELCLLGDEHTVKALCGLKGAA